MNSRWTKPIFTRMDAEAIGRAVAKGSPLTCGWCDSKEPIRADNIRFPGRPNDHRGGHYRPTLWLCEACATAYDVAKELKL